MTLAPDRPAQPEQLELVTVTVDGFELRVPKGTLIIRAAEQLGVQIPRFCDHPLLDPIGACRRASASRSRPARRRSPTAWSSRPS